VGREINVGKDLGRGAIAPHKHPLTETIEKFSINELVSL
jgi:hypothetical protein